jgi:hypothetical protein
MDEFGIAQAQPVVNPTAGKIANFLRKAKEFGNQYEVKDYVPLFGGTGIGDLFLGQAPEEVNRWSYGDYPFRNPSSVVGTGGNRLDVWKTGRFEPTFDVVANVALPAVGTAQMTAKPLARALAPKAAEMAESYLTKTGAIANITEPSPVKIAEALRQPPKNELGFYSPLDEAVMNLQNPKGTGQQYLAQLLKTQGVKQEEVSTRGLDTFLTNNPKVSREQIAQYLRENPVELKETVLGAGGKRQMDSMSEADYRLGEGRVLDDPDYVDNLADDEFYFIKNEDPNLVEHYRTQAFKDLEIDPMTADPSDLSRVDDLTDDYIRDAATIRAQEMYNNDPYYKFEDELGYTVTGSDNVGYTITDPNGREVPTPRNGIYSPNDAEDLIREDAFDRGFLHYADDEYGTKYHDYTLPNGENYREVLIQYPQKPASVKEMSDGKGWMAQGSEGSEPIYGKTREEAIERWQNSRHAKNYQSGHFDEPNILAHMRVTDRTIDGKKTLFVEEIQSDWHQAGRKKGYQGTADKDYTNYIKDLEKRYETEAFNIAVNEGLAEDKAKTLATKMKNKMAEDPRKLAEYFGESEKQQAMSMARVNDRSLVPDAPFKKNWQELAMKRAMQMASEGGYERVAFTTGKQQAERYNLAKYVDRVIYDKGTGTLRAFDKNNQKVMMQDVPLDKVDDYIGKEAARKLNETKPNENDEIILNNADLEIGGEGMKGFYDKILPDFINKYGKKHGLKVGQTTMDVKGGKPTDYADFEAYNAAKKGQGQEVHYFDLTPQAKESFLKKGQPLFAVPPAMAITDEDSRRDMLEKLFNNQK